MEQKVIDEGRKKKLDQLFEAFAVTSEGLYVYLCDMKYNYSRWSKEAVEFFDMPGEYMYEAGYIWEHRIHKDDREAYRQSLDALFSGKDTKYDVQYRVMDRTGEYVACTSRGVVLKDTEGNPEYFAGSIKNHGLQSHIDMVTGLRNQYGFFEDLKTIMDKKSKSIVLLCGISKFAEVNETNGYDYGNRVLQMFATLLRYSVGNAGSVYRMDGTKFAVISKVMTEAQLEMTYKAMQTKLRGDFYIDGKRQNLILNAGSLVVDNFEVSDKTIYSCLSYAYHESKNRHQGDFVEFHNELNDDNRRALERINVIRDSVLDGCRGFFLCYQPIVNAQTEKLVGMEALIRWRNETYGMVPPDSFIPILEQDMLFPELGKWILRQAMSDGVLFLNKYPNFRMNINLSYAQLEKSDFADIVIKLLNETGFPPENLCLEITERCRLLNLDDLRDLMLRLRDLGIKFALDDFGTGFSSLSILKALPVDVVKIDRAFVKDIEIDVKDQMTVKHVSELASVYGSDVCAEGIETKGMRDYLRQFSVNSLQGYLYSKPITFDDLLQSDIV
ncbi:MAG: EAL domain-containing protein [Lachnospiraceae bacterium]|nr:EAL domain-containing protein [Lachnospiraceae bacterium]